MKRRWETPKTIVDEFEANEYVAVCWGVACYIDEANEYERSIHNSAQDHRSEYCGTTGHQWLTDSNNDGTPERMSATDVLGTLSCTIYTDDTYREVRNIREVDVDDYIYWTTSSGSRTWHHQGKVTATTPGHPNRS